MKKGIKPKTKDYAISHSDKPDQFIIVTAPYMELALLLYVKEYYPKIDINNISNVRIDLAANRKNYIAVIITKRYRNDFFIIRF